MLTIYVKLPIPCGLCPSHGGSVAAEDCTFCFLDTKGERLTDLRYPLPFLSPLGSPPLELRLNIRHANPAEKSSDAARRDSGMPTEDFQVIRPWLVEMWRLSYPTGDYPPASDTPTNNAP
jgi:hypothetical protein